MSNAVYLAPLGTITARVSRLRRFRHWLRHRRPAGLSCERCWAQVGYTTDFD